MAPKKQKKSDEDPQQALKKILAAVVAPYEESLKGFQTTQLKISRNVQQNAANIKKIAEREPASIIPKELQALLPDIINGVIGLFTQPDTAPAAALKGIFDETMMNAYKKSTIAIWDMNAKMTQANLDSINIENELRRKRLKEEF